MAELYLAHPLDKRKEIREWELGVEKRSGVSLLNPFYDVPRPDILAIDRGEAVPGIKDKSQALEIRDNDLRLIDRTDGVVAILNMGYTFGAPMEVFYAYHERKMPVYTLVLEKNLFHPWVAECDNSTSFEELESKLMALARH